jgi:hypothetical protein
MTAVIEYYEAIALIVNYLPSQGRIATFTTVLED